MTSFVVGTGAWMRQRPDVASVLRRAPEDETVTRPLCAGVSTRLLRGTSILTRMSVDVAGQALLGSGLDPSEVGAVFCSSFGEIRIAMEQLDMLRSKDGLISPVAFKNSVHNTAAGVFSIAHKNHNPSAALAAGPCGVAYALLEAELLLDDGLPGVVVVIGDESKPPPLDQVKTVSFAAAFALSRTPANALAKLSPVMQHQQGSGLALQSEVARELAPHPAAPAADLLHTIATNSVATLGLGHESAEHWTVDVDVR